MGLRPHWLVSPLAVEPRLPFHYLRQLPGCAGGGAGPRSAGLEELVEPHLERDVHQLEPAERLDSARLCPVLPPLQDPFLLMLVVVLILSAKSELSTLTKQIASAHSCKRHGGMNIRIMIVGVFKGWNSG